MGPDTKRLCVLPQALSSLRPMDIEGQIPFLHERLGALEYSRCNRQVSGAVASSYFLQEVFLDAIPIISESLMRARTRIF